MNAAATPAFVTLNLPRIGLIWPEHKGFFLGLTGGQEGRPFSALILPDDKRVHFEDVAIGTYGKNVEGATSAHDGMANTIAFAEAGSELCRQILALEIDGHKDLFLPARQQAAIAAANAPELFNPEGWYTTSTQDGAHDVRVQDFEYGGSIFGLKYGERRAVAFRQIQLSH